MSNGICYCTNIEGFFGALKFQLDISQWCLFVDSLNRSLKAVLLHNGSKYPSLLLAHSVVHKETYECVKLLLNMLKYDKYGWDVIGDFKMIAFLMGLQGGFTKHPCYMCLWDSRDTQRHYSGHLWPTREGFTVGNENVKWEPLILQ